MTGTGARRRAAIVAAFAIQATVIAVALRLPAELPAGASAASSAAFPWPAPVGLAGQAVTVNVGGQVGSVAYPPRGTGRPPQFAVRAGSDASVTITVSDTNPAAAPPALIAVSDGSMGDGDQVLGEVGALPVGQVTFTVGVPATDLRPGHEATIFMAEVGPDGGRAMAPIADLLVS